MATVEQVLNIARQEIGYSRWTDPQPGSKYGRWYAQLTGDSYYGTNGVPYCAMFVSWVFYHAGQSAPGLPGAYCPWIVNAGRKAGKAVPVRQAAAGDMVLFDWGGDGVSDHIGIVEKNNGSYLICIEGNTSNGNNSNGGLVQRRTRAYSTVICIIRPSYGSASSSPNNGGVDMPLDNNDLNNITNVINNSTKLSTIEGTITNLGARINEVLGRVELNAPQLISGNEMYRVYNEATGQHLWTASQPERDALVGQGWKDEGVSWTMPDISLIHRLYNPYNGDHLLTSTYSEANTLVNAGWQYEGVAGVSSKDGTPVYRLYNEYTGQHVYSTNDKEIQNLKDNGWLDEGIQFYV